MKFIQLTPEDFAALLLAVYREGWNSCNEGEPEPEDDDVRIEAFLEQETYH